MAGRDGDDVETFYTSLYRSLLHPNTFNDADGRYIGFDGVIHTVAEGRTQYTNFSDWDTYRCLAALQALLFPKQASDMAQSLVNDAVQSGSFPRWALANAATGEMTGDSVVPLIVNLYAYGAKDFDVKTALLYMANAAITGGVGLNGYVERPGAPAYSQLGYAPEMVGPGASITLEWSVDDFAISRFADALGDAPTAAEFQSRAQYWQNLFNPTTHYISPRNLSGFFPDGPGFVDSPTRFGQYGFDEGNAEQYLWWVPHNIAGLVTALGGRKAVADRLDRFTEKLNEGPNEPVSVGRQRAGLRGAVALQLHRSTVEDPTHGRPGARALRSGTRRRARQRRPRRDVQLVRLGGPRPLPEHPGNADPHREHTDLRSRRNRASGRQIHPDLRAGRVGAAAT